MPTGQLVPKDECQKALKAVDMEPSVDFLHEFNRHQTKQSLVFDLQEPYRWIADAAVVEAFESGALDLPDFHFTGDDYRYRFEPQAKQRFLDLLRERFNSGARYKGRVLKWDTVVEQKTVELGCFLIGRSSNLDFTEPSPILSRVDDEDLRRRIVCLTKSEARKLGIGKSTLHYLKERARGSKPFKVRNHTLAKLEPLTV